MALAPSEEVLFQAIVAAPRRAIVTQADTRVIERPGWHQLITPSFKQGGLNEVSLAVLTTDQVAPVLDATIREYAQLGLRFRWTVGPDSAPAALPEALAGRGGQPNVLAGMHRGTEPIEGPASGIEVARVDEHNLETYVRVLASGWSMDEGPLLDFNRRILRTHRDTFPLYLARYQGEPVGVANCALLPASMYLQGSVVLPGWRGRGIYRALVGARLAEARARGLTLATVQARQDSSAPILARLGFATAWRFPSFVFKPA